jgi:hypothetical protein
MIVDRRVFFSGAALAAVTPAIQLLPPEFARPELNVIEPPVFKISGWSAADVLNPDNQLWVRVGLGWRTAWR